MARQRHQPAMVRLPLGLEPTGQGDATENVGVQTAHRRLAPTTASVPNTTAAAAAGPSGPAPPTRSAIAMRTIAMTIGAQRDSRSYGMLIGTVLSEWAAEWIEYRGPEGYDPYPMTTRLDWSDHADPEWLSRAVGPWRDRSGPLYKRLADAIREVVVAGDLPPGARLTPERELAVALGVSRSTVIGCYETLAQEGRLERRQGSGTRVASGPRGGTAPLVDRGSRIHPRPDERIFDLTIASPDVSDPVRRAMRHALEGFSAEELGHAYNPQGMRALRAAVADHLSRAGVPSRPEEILITSGAQQGLALLIASDVLPGEAVGVEDPAYAGIIDLVENATARPVAMTIDEHGLQPEALEAAARRGARLVHVVPTGQNPTGVVMPMARRREIGTLAARLGVTLIEDGVFEDVLRASRPLPAIAALGTGADVVTVGSLSKIFWAGLRTGWVRAGAPLIDRLVRLKTMIDRGSSLASQGAALILLDEVDAQRERMRTHVEDAIGVVERAVEESLEGWSWTPPMGGLSAWMRLPVPEATRFSRFARSMGVAVVPGSAMSPRGAFEDHVRISLGPPKETLAAALVRLGEAWRAFTPEAATRSEPAAAPV